MVSSTVVPPATSARTGSQTSLRPRGSSPVVGSSRNSTGGARIRLAARSPPPHPARVLLDRLGAGVGEPEPRQQLVGAAAGGGAAQVVEAAEQDQVLAAAEDLVDGRVLAEQPGM